ncbi:MAG: hypothetical protein JSU63_13675 [Phycisphaerales bacterium]|nr:MAG: hypothetical protein JSU63_13675 [Phycisphaerales bacterium]
MLPIRRIAGFFVRFTVVFVLLVAPWPGVHEAYATVYRAGGNLLFGRFGYYGNVEFRPAAKPTAAHDTEAVLTNWRTEAKYTFVGSSQKGYLPTAFVLALILATPIPWYRRWRAVVWGLLLVSVYVVLRLGIFLALAFSGDNGLSVFSLGSAGRSILDYLHWVIVDSFAGWLILPLPIWIVVSFRRQDWVSILQGAPASAAKGRCLEV